ncbi:hypothetical protein Tco_1031704 [Tanacetum coccineum]|uniref:Uncharacterized protein n=1 Tax=Tanacetum coccineum TaxID=301880 RepID=A0ABQ5G9R4_9ASTR
MNQEAIQQATREEAWVPKADRVKISTINMRIDPTMTQKEETYQVVLDIIKNTSFYKAFLASADVPEIYMQQFWFTITKIKDTNFYEFKLENKKCLVDVEVFRQALNICPRVPGKEFIVPPPEEELLTFLIRLGYKGVLTHLPQMFIDHMHQPWRTRASIINKCLSRKTTIIINHFLTIHKSVPNALPSGLYTIKDNGVLSRMKFVRIGEDIQEYGRAIPDTMLTNDIKQFETYQMFIKYSTCLIHLKKIRGKGSQCKKAVVSKKPASVKVSDESNSEPTRKRIGSRKVINKKVVISVEDNIIPEPDVALELIKSISLTEAAEEEAARQVHATHERIQKGIQTLTPAKQLAANMMQALKASRSQSLTRGSNKGTGVSPGVPNESTIILTTSSEGNGTKPRVPDKEKMYSNEEAEKKDDDDDKSIDIEETDDEETDDEFVRDAEKTEEVKDDNKKAALPPSSSSLLVSLGFSNQFLNLLSDKSTVGNLNDTADAEINSLLDIQIQKEIAQIQSPSILTVPVSVISELAVLSKIPKIPTVSSAITPPPPHSKDVQELKEVDHTTTLLASLKPEIPSAVNAYLGSSLGDVLQKVLQKHAEELKQQYSQQVNYKEAIKELVQANVINEVKNLLPKFLPKAVSDFAILMIQSTIKKALENTPLVVAQSSSQAQSSLKAAESLSEYELKTILFEKMDKSRSYLTHDK